MGGKPFSPLLLLVPVLFLGAAAPPPDCGSFAGAGQTLPMALDLAGRPNVPAGLTGHTVAVPAPSGERCPGALPSTAQTAPLRNEPADALHGLPGPDILQPIDEPRLVPSLR